MNKVHVHVESWMLNEELFSAYANMKSIAYYTEMN
jgi:hypothetical protein